MAAYIERQIANRQFTFTLVIMAAQQRADAGVQLLQGEGFNQIIICADIQPGNAVIERIAGGQNEYRQVYFFCRIRVRKCRPSSSGSPKSSTIRL